MLIASLVCVVGLSSAQAATQSDFDDAPIRYESTESNDRVAKLARQLQQGETKLQWNETDGYLRDLLQKLEITPESQTLVFSKTSLQATLICPSNPRALFFSDDAYLGYVPGGRTIELSAVDPIQGAVFYSIDQKEMTQPLINRDRTECMTCHGTAKTQEVPGYLVRSLFTTESGQPNYSLGTTTTNHTTPLADRFGGWYVTGQHGTMRHRGNVFVEPDQNAAELDVERGANLDTLPARVDTNKYPAEHSDIVALMVLEHQSQMHNAITAASYEARRAAHYDKQMNELFERPIDQVSESTKRRIKAAGDRLLKQLLFSEEAKLTSAISGSSNFRKQFEAKGPFDGQRRSLRQFDLQTRLFKYPCSFLVYSESFSSLPSPMLDYVESKLVAILKGECEDAAFAHVSKEDRAAIFEILVETKAGFRERVSGSVEK